MTPTPPSPKGKSGNPATQARINQTVKQQREAQRQEKLQEYQRQLTKRRRSKLAWWTGGGLAGIVVVGLVVASFIFAPEPAPSYTANNSTGAKIEGVETFTNETLHVTDPVEYPQSPPAGGNHFNAWLNCGVYTEPQENELAVHSQEHGAIWVTYDAATVTGDELATLKSKLPSSYVVLSPYEGLDSPIVLSGWNTQLKLDSASDPRIEQFFTEFWRSQFVPEPNASCTGAIDGPGRV